ncbi:MAG: Na/Pi cotransporter family protein [Lachnospiraceae bacterium]|nr:Na/Pi cotransporter family protein [Lachnospiraceae bacterium]
MSTGMIVAAVLTLLGGIGVFLVACSTMSSNLEAAGSERLKALFAKTAGSKLLGVGIGAAGTAAIQSSGATTVMVIGFVNVGILSLRQAAAIIFGANIGTTITGQIVALGMSGSGAVSTTVLFSALAGVGAFCITFGKSAKWKTLGGILAGFGMLFIGLNIMSSSMEAFAQDEAVIRFLAGINNAVLLVLIGAAMTAIVQSSSVMTSVAITMVVAGLVTIDQGIFLTMGSNIGSCVVAMIAGLSGSTNAKRTAAIHLLFNSAGVIFFLVLTGILHVVAGADFSMGGVFAKLFPSAPHLQLAMFHTVFNVCTVVLMLPLSDQMVKLIEKMIPDKTTEDPDAPRLHYLDENMLRTPVVAIGQLKKEIVNMGDIAIQNFYRALHIITTLEEEEIETFRAREKELDFLNAELVKYIVRLTGKTLNAKDRAYLNTTLRSVADLERIGDYSENIVEYADNLKKGGDRLIAETVEEIGSLKKLMEELYAHCMRAYTDGSRKELELADEIEDRIDDFTERMAENHVRRMSEGTCTPNAGAQCLELSSDAERVADHLINVAKTIKKTA